MFSNQKIFLDVKDYSKIGQLEATIRQFGGVIEKFLSKEITCVVTNRARTEGVSLQKNVSASASTHGQSFRPSASGSRVMSRGQTLLMHSNSCKDMSVCEPVAFAEMWGIKIVTLDTIVQAIDRQLQACSPSSPATKQSVKPHHVMKKTNFVGAFIKVEDAESNFRPFFSQYLTFPHLDLEGDLSNGIFKCAENVRPVATRKNVSTPAASARKQKVWSKPGYCECCDTMYDDLSQHLTSTDHQRFSENVENFAAVDKLIDQICSSDGNGLSLPADDYCTPDVASKTKSTERAEEMRSSNCNDPSAAAVESAAYHVGCLRENQSSDQHDKPDKVVDTVENCRESRSISGEEAAKYCRSPLHSSSGVNTCSVNSENHHADDGGRDKVCNVPQSPILEVHCNAGIMLSTSVTVTSLVDYHKTTEAPCNVKSCGMLVGGNPTNSDDMPQFISSDCVVNLLELLSSDNSVDSALHADETGSVTATKSLESPHMPTVCTSSSDTVCNEMLPYEPKHCQPTTTASVSAEYNFPLTLMQNDFLDRHCNAGMMEQDSAVGDKFRTKCEPGSNTLMLPDLSNVPILPPTDVAVSKTSLIVNDEMNRDNFRSSCGMKVDCDALVLRSSPSYARQPAACTLPVYASSDVNNSPAFDDCAFLPVHCGLTADSFDLCNKLLTTVYASEHHKQQNFSSAPVRSDIPADSSHLHNKLLATVCASDVAEHDGQQNFSSAPVGSDILADCFDMHDKLLTMGYAADIAEHDKQQHKNCSSSVASYPCFADYVAVSTSVNNNFWLPMTFSPPLCFSEGSVNCTDDSLHTPVHSPSHLLESPAAFSTLSADISTKSASLCCSSPASVFNYLADVNDSLQSSMSCNGSQRDIEVNVMSNKQASACFAQEKEDLQVNSHPCRTFDSELEYDMTAECTSLHEAEDYYKSTSADIETRLIDNVSCCVKPFIDVLDSVMSPFSALSLQSEVHTVSSVVVPESYNSTEPVGLTDADTDSDSACTVVYNYDCLASSVLEHASDSCSSGKDKIEATGHDGQPSVPSANAVWKVISCADCRMRLARTEAVLPTPFAQNNTEVKSKSSRLAPESHRVSKSLHEEDASDNSSTSTMVNNCDSVTIGKHAGDRPPCENESETNVDLSVSSANCMWKVISFEDCRMKLARSKAALPALCATTVSSDSRHCFAKNSCHSGSKLFLPNMDDSVLTC